MLVILADVAISLPETAQPASALDTPEPIIVTQQALGSPPWATVDPFLFCVHHDDAYPRGNAELGPATSLAGRRIGMDFEGKDGWRMYHGDKVPGFPQHPHRGFETVTIVRRGLIDHSDSLGAAARFGKGDVQWMTAGRGIVHSEMFPLLREDADNPLELFQIWLNLPKADKFVEPHFSMLWSEQIPRVVSGGGDTPRAELTMIAGAFGEQRAPAPPPHSWASRADADLAIWTVQLENGASIELPPSASADTLRTLYFFKGGALRVGAERISKGTAAVLRSDVPVRVAAEGADADCLVLQARPIAEPVVQYGPFVMNTQQEIRQAMSDYQQTRFGGWPWPSDAPTHPRAEGRFARHADGRIERP
jgi:redox-sensitive bicupin YhaK (pirin superfamily)